MAKKSQSTDAAEEAQSAAVQCPNCGYVFDTQTGERADEHAAGTEPEGEGAAETEKTAA